MTELLHADEEDKQLMPGIQADLTLAAVRILAAAGAAMRAAAPDGYAAQAEELQGDLLQLCRQGAPKAAKAAVRWGSARGSPMPLQLCFHVGQLCQLCLHAVQAVCITSCGPSQVLPVMRHGMARQHLQEVQLIIRQLL